MFGHANPAKFFNFSHGPPGSGGGCPVGENNIGATAGQLQADAATDTARSARDQGHLSRKVDRTRMCH
jgi:hypothetical protein